MGYFGSKASAGTYHAIIAAMPPHDCYIESHMGSGVVMAHKPPAARSIGIDLDPDAPGFQTAAPGVERHCTDAAAFLANFDYAGAGRVLVYADPPYVWRTRTSTHRYRHDYTDLMHIQLLDTLKRIPAFVILSGYPSPLYDDNLPGWRTIEFQTMTRGGVRTEKLWLNFPAHAGAHWATFAGKNFRERQHIKRKAKRWAKNFADMPAGERLAVLAAMLETIGAVPIDTAPRHD